ncbi:MAG: cytochrome P450 [Acidimicrobiales bacterium]|nr:cytochrome P450 [Acidimicrobiales bacterium]
MPQIDLLSVSNFAGSQPHDQFAWLRDNAPVFRHPEPDGPGFWAVTRYHDVKEVGRDHERFSSRPTVMIADPSDASALGDEHVMMLMADPPLHTRMRRLVARDFTPKAASALQGRVAELATRIVDAVIERGECDLVTDVAGEMPSFVIADILGIPLDDGRELYHLTEALHASDEVRTREERAEALLQMFAYAGKTYHRKRANPSQDLASFLASAEVDGKPIDEIDFALWFMLLVDAGGDTTRNLIGAGFDALFGHPDQFDWLRADPEGRLPAAIEELLRWVSPVVHMRRTATCDTELAGQAIAAGDKVVIFYGSANRDPAVFDRADRLDLGRTNNPHIAFGGGGPHYCLGANLARVEIAALMSEVLGRMDDLEPAGDPTWMGSNFVFGPTSLPVRFRPGTRIGS